MTFRAGQMPKTTPATQNVAPDGASSQAQAPNLGGRPFCIWTLQRTGGTNFKAILNAASDAGSWEDEPFNHGRQLFRITKVLLEEDRPKKLATQIERAMAKRKNFKHCVEVVPFPITTALIGATSAEYRHLVLYRKVTVDRLLSVEFALRTQVWGPGAERASVDEQAAFNDPLDIEKLVERAQFANFCLQKTWNLLVENNASVAAISFEELYSEPQEVAGQALARIFAAWEVPIDPSALTGMVQSLRGRGNQRTSNLYNRFKGADILQQKANALPAFTFQN